MTNDGAVTNRLIHPRHAVEKEYWVWVSGDLARALPHLRGPMELDGVPLAPAKVTERGANCLSIVIHEGKNRQVRRMCAQAGLTVKTLRRVREGPIFLGDLPVGRWRPLANTEVAWFRKLLL